MVSRVVFVVDSSRRDAELTATQVKALGLEPLVFHSADDCLSALATREPLALLVSLQLEPERGDVCCQRIKENYAWRHLPIIIITQTEQAHELMYCWRAAANDFLRRPVTQEKLSPKLAVIRDSAARRDEDKDKRFAGCWVLLLETSRFYRNVIGSNLEHAGLHVLYSEEPEEALELAEEHRDKLDGYLVGLPSLPNALEVGTALSQVNPRAKTPMLLLSPGPKVDEALQAKVIELTGSSPLNKRDLPFDLVLSKILSRLKPTNVMELRSCERVPFFSVVEFSNDGREWGCGFSYDVSAGGIFIRTLTPLAAGQPVTLRMDFVGQSAVSKGVIAWANPFRPRVTFASPVGMGVRLTQMAPQLSEQITGLQRNRPATDVPTP
jgi:CheY-like chemotaxis protein